MGQDREDRASDARRRAAIAASTAELDDVWIERFESEVVLDDAFERSLFRREAMIVAAIVALILLRGL